METLQLRRPSEAPSEPRFVRDQLVGRLIELSSSGSSSVLTAAVGLVLDVQRDGAPAAWIATADRLFFPPDLVDSGVDLAALAVIRVPSADVATRAADRLLRSGAFGIVVIDYGTALSHLSLPAQSRLTSLAQKHRSIVACLTEKPATTDSLGSLVSLRAEAKRAAPPPFVPSTPRPRERFDCNLSVLKDKRHGPNWQHREACRGPAGLR